MMLALGVLNPGVQALGDSWSLKDIFKKSVNHTTSYALLANTISYTSEADFDPNGEMMRSVELSPGESLKYACGIPGNGTNGTFTAIPQDPVRYVLDYKGDADMDVALTRVRPSYSVYRSDATIVVGAFQKIGFDHLLITYDKDSIIAANNPDRFSINLVCMFQSNGEATEPRYRWLQIKFKNVVSLAYGCGSVMFHMFKNTIPMSASASPEETKLLRFCSINAEPGMVVGIYCDKDEHVYPDNCFVQTQSVRTENVSRSGLLETDFPYNSPEGRLRLARVRDRLDGYNSGSACFCKDKSNVITASVKVLFNMEQVCDYEKFMHVLLRRRALPHYKCHKELRAGGVVKLVIPKLDQSSEPSKVLRSRGIYPRKIMEHTYISGDEATGLKPIKIDEILGRVGLFITKKEDSKNEIYEFKASTNAILVLRTEVANLTYLYEFYDTFKHSLMPVRTIISMGIVPTDPFTYGCGASSSTIFNYDGVHFDNKAVTTNLGTHNETHCTVNGYANSPVGFYCPPNFTLYPEDCFSSAILVSTGRKVAVSDYVPLARVVKSKNIKVLDFSIPSRLKTGVTYSNEKLQCKCQRNDGAVMATITLDLSNPYPRA